MTGGEYLAHARIARRASDANGVHHFTLLAMGAAEDVDTAYHARACVGRMYLQRAEPLLARPWFRDAREVARAAGHRLHEAVAAHDLFVCERDLGDREAARRWSETALDLYGSAGRCGAFLADLAVFREPAAAWVPYFLPYIHPRSVTSDRIAALANLAESAADAGRREVLRRRGAELLRLVRHASDREGVAAALLTLACALGTIGDFGDGEKVAAEAERRAGLAGEDVVRQRAERARDAFGHGHALRD